MKQKFDIYYLAIAIIYIVASLMMYSQWGLLMTSFLIIVALSFIVSSFFKRNIQNKDSKFILFCYLFVMFSMVFPFAASIYRNDIHKVLFVFLMGMVFFILYLKEIKSIKKSR